MDEEDGGDAKEVDAAVLTSEERDVQSSATSHDDEDDVRGR